MQSAISIPQLRAAISGTQRLGRDGTDGRPIHTAAGAHGLATGFGDTASVGIGGITLGGGVGFLVRKHGLTIDDLLAAEVVTAAGQLLRTTRTRWLSRTKANGA
jgi:FAD binding domain